MKDGVLIIDAARGGVMDEEALLAALSRERSPALRWMCLLPSRQARRPWSLTRG